MDAIIFFYGIVLPVVTTYNLVFEYWQCNIGHGDVDGNCEFGFPLIALLCIHLWACTGGWWLIVAVTAIAEIIFILVMFRREHIRNAQEKERLDAAEAAIKLAAQRKREAFAVRINFPPNDPVIDGAYAVLTEEARNSIQNREQLTALLGEYADSKQRDMRRKRLFRE